MQFLQSAAENHIPLSFPPGRIGRSRAQCSAHSASREDLMLSGVSHGPIRIFFKLLNVILRVVNGVGNLSLICL